MIHSYRVRVVYRESLQGDEREFVVEKRVKAMDPRTAKQRVLRYFDAMADRTSVRWRRTVTDVEVLAEVPAVAESGTGLPG